MPKPLHTIVTVLSVLLLTLATAQETTSDMQDMAMVRLVQLAPNAADASVLLTTEQEGTNETLEAFTGLAYGDTTDYMTLSPGNYQLTVRAMGENQLADTEMTYEVEENFSAGSYTTLVVLGLVLPEVEVEVNDDDEGFFTWVTGLFSGDEALDSETLRLRVESYRDDLATPLASDELRLRVVHASPGTNEIDIITEDPDEDDDDRVLISNLAYADVSGYENLEQLPTRLRVRLADSDTTALDLVANVENTDTESSNTSAINMEMGMVHTIFVVGTSAEQVPLEALVLSNTPVEDTSMQEPTPAGEPSDDVESDDVDSDADSDTDTESDTDESDADVAVEDVEVVESDTDTEGESDADESDADVADEDVDSDADESDADVADVESDSDESDAESDTDTEGESDADESDADVADVESDSNESDTDESDADTEDESDTEIDVTVVDVAAAYNELSVFAVAVASSNLAETLANDGPYTVFAPNNDAFDTLDTEELDALLEDEDALDEVLRHHVVEGDYSADELAEMDSVTTLAGTELTLSTSNENISVADALVVLTLSVDNGTVHVINQVLMPENEQ